MNLIIKSKPGVGHCLTWVVPCEMIERMHMNQQRVTVLLKDDANCDLNEFADPTYIASHYPYMLSHKEFLFAMATRIEDAVFDDASGMLMGV